ncbi:hypothetical protein [Phenylobacterium soli]|uniref:hypothetical protein n=1 Tax=Phenylobacterium soli TaxID=2170551 RepID=UPI001D04C539
MIVELVGRLKTIVSPEPDVVIALRSEPAPESLVFVTVSVGKASSSGCVDWSTLWVRREGPALR